MTSIGIADKETLDLVKQDTANILAKDINLLMISHFAWAGKAYPFAGSSDLTISSNTTWTPVTHPQGFVKVKKLTINASRTLTIQQSPFIIFAEEVVGGGANAIIDASGPSGASSGDFSCGQAWGGTTEDANCRAQGGCGGGFLIILCNKFSGTAISVKANGGNGYRTTPTAATQDYSYGRGAFSNTDALQKWDGSSNVSTSGQTYLHPVGIMLGNGGGYNGNGGTGGGSGPGGSGIGGGGGVNLNSATDGTISKIPLTPLYLLELFKYGCKGGGGGGALKSTTANKNQAGGGGGGAILIISNDSASVQPTMQADGGTAASGSAATAGNGAAGITYYINFEA